MPLNPGHDSVTFIYPGVVADRLHKTTAKASTQFVQTGCNVQPMGVKDQVSDTSYSEATHRLMTPYNDSTAAVQAEWFAQFGDIRARILGRKHHRDPFGRGVHITFVLKEENG